MSRSTIDIVNRNLAKRYAKEKRFRLFGLASILAGLTALCFLLVTIVSNGWGAFTQSYVQLTLDLDPEMLSITDPLDDDQWSYANYTGVIKKSLRERFPDVTSRKDKKRLYRIISPGAGYQVNLLMKDRSLLGQTVTVWLPADDDVDSVIKGHIDRNRPENERRVTDKTLALIDELVNNGELERKFNNVFFTAGDSSEPEQAGIKGAMLGSFFTLIVALLLSFPIGIAAAIYLEEFAPKNKWTDFIEVNINNLAAVPSIVFGLLGLAVFLNWFGLPRSVPLVGGIVLTLMTLPTIIISSRVALKSVPPSIREAALGLGASKMQTIFDHVLPLALPGMLTGGIIGMAQALGETAPLLMIGMVAFIVDVPGSFTDPATVLPVQIFLWSDSPERAFVERTSGAIMVLLMFLILMNSIAVLLRKRFERRW
ncbi:MAG TPA: phosphate ABC transporter permease PtsA [Cellvibrionales bacterium]|jgi:phosphate transport system permease protein|nr:phosphate ABC transporter permease PstA [Pseudomonadales bacterium]HAB56117.1 phosphate ABC transporter permease PtsA [Cellvibrionales bacterium]HCX27004.1 phosphate ABC transporter permease PtsA [Cellvibrionales bacterium]